MQDADLMVSSAALAFEMWPGPKPGRRSPPASDGGSCFIIESRVYAMSRRRWLAATAGLVLGLATFSTPRL